MTAEYCIFANRTNNLYQNRRLAARLQTVERYYLNYEETVDIRPLKKIWEEYDEQRTENQIAERKFNAARSATGIITMLAIACSLILGHGPIYLILYGLAIGISLVFTILAYKKSSDIPRQQKEMTKQFQKRYVCPKCGHFMGFQDYDILIQGDACPYCKTKYKKWFCTFEAPW